MSIRDPRPVLHVCTSCRLPGAAPHGPCDGRKLFDAVDTLHRALADATLIALNGVECMSGCKRPCTVALSAPDKPGYLFGDLVPDAETANQALELAVRYRASETGKLMRADRPSLFRTGILARIPALVSPHE